MCKSSALHVIGQIVGDAASIGLKLGLALILSAGVQGWTREESLSHIKFLKIIHVGDLPSNLGFGLLLNIK